VDGHANGGAKGGGDLGREMAAKGVGFVEARRRAANFRGV
jgi:hypothetical protein